MSESYSSSASEPFESSANEIKDNFSECSPPKVKNVRMDENSEESNSSLKKSEIPLLDHEWRGVPLDSLKICDLKDLYPPVKPSDNHTVLFKVPVIPGQPFEPFPRRGLDIWDKDHVRMPHSSHSLSPVSKTELGSRWNLILEAFSKPINSSQDLEAAILHYNSKYADKWSFSVLHYFFTMTLLEEESDYFFANVLPCVVKLALSLPDLVTGGIPLLRQRQTSSVSLTQKQIACLLANAFLCTFPRRNIAKTASEYKNYPDINFNRLYSFGLGDHVQEKLKCLINYFRRVCTKCPEGVVTYSRHYVPSNSLPVWSESNSTIPELHVTSVGSIEDEGTGMLELDFANKFVGGGVLGRGCVQEEIRFVICPELIAARLFTECLDDTEALIVTGVERYNLYKGYGNSFEWAGSVNDQTPRDCYGRRLCILVAVDAFHFHQAEKQYTPHSINRELNKAYAGFSWGISSSSSSSGSKRLPKGPRLSVATGNWGCGAFGGDAKLKALLQLMVAGQTGRKVAYFTFGDPELRDKLADVHKFLVSNNVTVGQLWKLLCIYHNNTSSNDGSDQKKKKKKPDLYSYIYHWVSNAGQESTDVAEGSNTSKLFSEAENKPKCPTTELNAERRCRGLSSEEIGEALLEQDSCDINPKQTPSGKSDGKPSANDVPESNNSKSEPMEVKSYSVSSKEGRVLCLQRQKDSWARIEESKKDFNEFQIVDDDDVDMCLVANQISSDDVKQSPVTKRKISDYFSSTPKV